MDYEVFLLSRVREEYLRTGDNSHSVREGIASTARVITAAASVMVIVFLSFMLNDQRVVNLFGFGLAFAILVDATLVRLVLVPATMDLAGRANWWMPRWLDRILPTLGPDPHGEAGAQPALAGGSPAAGTGARPGDTDPPGE
jgi:RND superfamily putative drug exporter